MVVAAVAAAVAAAGVAVAVAAEVVHCNHPPAIPLTRLQLEPRLAQMLRQKLLLTGPTAQQAAVERQRAWMTIVNQLVFQHP